MKRLLMVNGSWLMAQVSWLMPQGSWPIKHLANELFDYTLYVFKTSQVANFKVVKLQNVKI